MSLILNKGLDDALQRANAYINAGADGIMIHSKKNANEVFAFCKSYNKFKNRMPLIVVPSTFDKTYEKDLEKNGISIVIYANQLIEAVYLLCKRPQKIFLKINDLLMK